MAIPEAIAILKSITPYKYSSQSPSNMQYYKTYIQENYKQERSRVIEEKAN